MENLDIKNGCSQLETEFSLFSSNHKSIRSSKPKRKRSSLNLEFDNKKKGCGNMIAFGSKVKRFPLAQDTYSVMLEELFSIVKNRPLKESTPKTSIGFGSKQLKCKPFQVRKDGPGPAQYSTDRKSMEELLVPKLTLYRNVVKRSKVYRCSNSIGHFKVPGPGYYQAVSLKSPRTYSNLFKTATNTFRTKQIQSKPPKSQVIQPRFQQKAYKRVRQSAPNRQQYRTMTNFIENIFKQTQVERKIEFEQSKQKVEKPSNIFIEKNPNPFTSYVRLSQTPSPDSYNLPSCLNPKTQVAMAPRQSIKTRKKPSKTDYLKTQ